MGSIGAPEILVVLVVALLVLGPERLPDAARQVGRFISEIRRIGSGLQAEMRDAIDFDLTTPTPTSTPAPGAPPPPGAHVDPPPPPPPPASPPSPAE